MRKSLRKYLYFFRFLFACLSTRFTADKSNRQIELKIFYFLSCLFVYFRFLFSFSLCSVSFFCSFLVSCRFVPFKFFFYQHTHIYESIRCICIRTLKHAHVYIFIVWIDFGWSSSSSSAWSLIGRPIVIHTHTHKNLFGRPSIIISKMHDYSMRQFLFFSLYLFFVFIDAAVADLYNIFLLLFRKKQKKNRICRKK